MKPEIRRKFLAQRKFAQGASVERRSDVAAKEMEEKRPHKKIIFTGTSASNLLDMVSLKNLHSHSQEKLPIVLVKRLPEDVPREVAPVSVKIRKVPTRPVKESAAHSHKMTLRERSRKENVEFSAKKRPRRKSIAPKSPILSGFSTEDDMPLKHITREQHHANKRTNHQMNHQEGQAKRKKATQVPTAATFGQNEISEDIVVMEPSTDPDIIGQNEVSEDMGNCVVMEPTRTTAADIIMVDRESLDDEESLKLRYSESETKEDETKDIIPEASYYGRSQIEKWIDTPDEVPLINEVDLTFKIPASTSPKKKSLRPKHTTKSGTRPTHDATPQEKLATPEERRNLDDDSISDLQPGSELQERIPSPCPSTKFGTIMSLASASQADLDSRCTQCRHCRKVDKYIELRNRANLFENSHSRPSNDVYAFDDSCSAAAEPILYGFRQNRRINNNPNTDKEMYLDLLPNGSHILKLISVKIPNKDKTIMKAKLVPKSEVNKMDLKKKSEEVITLMESESFLEELLTSLNADATVPTNTHNVKPVQSNSNKANVGKSSCSPKSSSKSSSAGVVEAPTFFPTEAEFENPSVYLEKVAQSASQYGICKIVPPKGFKPDCNISQLSQFTAMNQYPGKMFSRWGSATREYCAIKATTNVPFRNPPLINNVEVNVPELYHIVQRLGGLSTVIAEGKWQKVAEEMNYPNAAQVVKKLDNVYVKYLLPYETLSSRERQEVLQKVDKAWNERYKRMKSRAKNPLHKQKQVLGEASSEEDDDDEDTGRALDKADDCIVQGRTINLNMFEKVAGTVLQMFFGQLGREPTPQEVEEYYWRLVVCGDQHVCVNSAAVDTGIDGYGFSKNKNDPYAKHPWNLKVLNNTPGSVLRFLGSVQSVTVPTLHLGMVFSTSCWHRDPHGLPWIEYLHQGASKIWYGIPDEQSDRFRKAVKELCPAYCQQKSIWLPSDIAMIPPNMFKEHNITLSRIVQKPGEFIVIFPKAYSCSVATGFTVSESVYYALFSWLTTIQNDFQEVRDSFEPTMFPLEQLLIAMAQDARVPASALPVVYRALDTIVRDELLNRAQLRKSNVTFKDSRHPPRRKSCIWNARELQECDVCRATLFISKVTLGSEKKARLPATAYCLQHALRILESAAGSDRVSGTTVFTYFTEPQLEAIFSKLRKRFFPDV